MVRLSHRGSLIVIRTIPPAHEKEEEKRKRKRHKQKQKQKNKTKQKKGGGGAVGGGGKKKEKKQDCLFHWEHGCRCLFTSLSHRFDCFTYSTCRHTIYVHLLKLFSQNDT